MPKQPPFEKSFANHANVDLWFHGIPDNLEKYFPLNDSNFNREVTMKNAIRTEKEANKKNKKTSKKKKRRKKKKEIEKEANKSPEKSPGKTKRIKTKEEIEKEMHKAVEEIYNIWITGNPDFQEDVSKGSHKIRLFQCNKCYHVYSTQVRFVAYKKGNTGCPYCHSNKLCYGECDFCFKKSFASNAKMAKLWSPDNKTTPLRVFRTTDDKYAFKCNKCNREFITCPHCMSKGSGCPLCKNKTEGILYDFLLEEYKNGIDYQAIFAWCEPTNSNNKAYIYDFVLEKYKIIIELDGSHHFIPVKKWKSTPEKVQKRDLYKANCAYKNGYTIIRLLQDDVWYNKLNWKELLISLIREYDSPDMICIEKEDGELYDKLIEKFNASKETN